MRKEGRKKYALVLGYCSPLSADHVSADSLDDLFKVIRLRDYCDFECRYWNAFISGLPLSVFDIGTDSPTDMSTWKLVYVTSCIGCTIFNHR